MMKKIKIILGLLMVLIYVGNITFVSADSTDFAYNKITLLNQDPDPAEPGHYVELRFKVEKLGNNILRNITFTLDAPYPFSFDPSDNPIKTLGDMKGYSDEDGYYLLYYKLRVDSDALEDIYTVKLKENNGEGDILITREFDIRVNNDKPEFVLGTLVTSPTKLVSDTDEAELDIELENIGEMDAQNIILQMELPKGFTETYGYSSRANLGTISAGSSKTGQFFVDIDENVKDGVHKAKVAINYKEADSNDDEYKTKTLWLDIPIKSKPVFGIEKVTSFPEKIHAGDSVKLKLNIKNIGGEDAESTSIRVFKESSQPFDFDDKTDYIGKLKPEGTGEALLKFNVEKDASPKTYLLDLEIRCINGDDVITQDKTIKIQVISGEKNTPNKIIGINITTIIIILGLGIYNFFRKKKERKKERN